MLTKVKATDQEQRVAAALIAASKEATRERKKNDAFWLAMAQAAIRAVESQ